MTSYLTALGGLGVLGTVAYNNIIQGNGAFKTQAGRACMHVSHLLLTCCATHLISSDSSPSLFGLAMAVGGTALYLMKAQVNVSDAEKRFDTQGGRLFETLGNIGGAYALIQLGKCMGVGPMSLAYYTATALYHGAVSLPYHALNLASQVGLGAIFGS